MSVKWNASSETGRNRPHPSHCLGYLNPRQGPTHCTLPKQPCTPPSLQTADLLGTRCLVGQSGGAHRVNGAVGKGQRERVPTEVHDVVPANGARFKPWMSATRKTWLLEGRAATASARAYPRPRARRLQCRRDCDGSMQSGRRRDVTVRRQRLRRRAASVPPSHKATHSPFHFFTSNRLPPLQARKFERGERTAEARRRKRALPRRTTPSQWARRPRLCFRTP